ncbi:hypothetical protein [Pedobacter mendelii]|uniref:Uncharacterized protein n=1 Tax=Pedobacter mendelii TaxID=1908240 RepID=A0ABQ2BCB3_9SPHI|nr:hypothetical protein [Pedobacter mendelii]GGI22821.1 hypothetical protein GCM10008119_04560 [Pedobacter mendelii]
MNTKYLMISSSIFLALVGISCAFAPEEILKYGGLASIELLAIMIQMLGALFLGFAILNWTAKSNLIGGIYSKPVSLGNFLHFIVGAITLAKYFSKHLESTFLLIPLTIYTIFAIAFGLVSFGRNEFKKQS